MLPLSHSAFLLSAHLRPVSVDMLMRMDPGGGGSDEDPPDNAQGRRARFFFFFFLPLIFSRGAEPRAKNKRGYSPLDASNAPKGHPKQAFIPSETPNRMVCLLCKAKYPREPGRWLVAHGSGPQPCNQHLLNVHGFQTQSVPRGQLEVLQVLSGSGAN